MNTIKYLLIQGMMLCSIVFFSFGMSEDTHQVPEINICDSLNRLSPDGSDEEYANMIKLFHNNGFSVSDCLREYWQKKENEELKEIEERTTQKVETQELLKKLAEVKQTQMLEKINCDEHIPAELCETVKQFATKEQMARNKKNKSKKKTLATLQVTSSDNVAPHMDLKYYEEPFAYTLNFGDDQYWKNKTKEELDVLYRHELCHLFEIDTLSQDQIRKIAKTNVMRLSRINEKRADTLLSKNSVEALATYNSLVNFAKIMQNASWLDTAKWKTIALENCVIFRKSYWYPPLSHRIKWAKRVHRLFEMEEKLAEKNIATPKQDKVKSSSDNLYTNLL